MSIYVFTSLNDAVERLNNHSKSFKYPFESILQSKEDIVKYSAGGNIFRALGTKSARPSIIYRNWANGILDNLIKDLSACNNQNRYTNIISTRTDDLLNYWANQSGEKLGYGPASKLVNLLIKIMNMSDHSRIDNIIQYQHVPLDSFSLQPLKNIINDITKVNYGINIPTNASMSFINSTDLYNVIQEAIFNLYATKLKKQYPPIFFDFYAWNDQH